MAKIVFVIAGVILAVLGIGGIVVGSILPGFFDAGLKALLPSDPEDEEVVCKDACDPEDKPNDVYVFSVTNAKDVITSGAAPEVTQTKVEFTVTEQDYDMDYNEADDSIGKHSFSKFTPKNEADYDLEFITLNPLYPAVVANAGSEAGFLAFAAGQVAGGLIDQLGELQALLPFIALATYTGGIVQTCTGITVPADSNDALCLSVLAQSFDFADVPGGDSASLTPTYLAGAATQARAAQTYSNTVNASLGKYSLFENVGINTTNVPFVGALLNEAIPVSMTNTTGLLLWAAAADAFSKGAEALPVLGAVREQIRAGFAPFLAASPDPLPKTMTDDDFSAVLTYIGASLNPAYAGEVLAGYAMFSDLGSLAVGQGTYWKETFSSYEDLLWMHMGSGAILPYSAGAITGTAAFEFYYSQAVNGDCSACVSITGPQAKAMMYNARDGTTAIPENYAPTLCGTAAAAGGLIAGGDTTTAAAILAGFADVGLGGGAPFATLAPISRYVCSYLTQEFLLKPKLETFDPQAQAPTPIWTGGFGMDLGQLNDDGTSMNNTGLFIKRTLREIMHGYEDPFFRALAGSPWAGFFGPKLADVAAARGLDQLLGRSAKKTRKIAGNNNLDDLEKFVEVEGLKKIDKLTDLGLDCPSTAVFTSGLASECKLWGAVQNIEGEHDTRWPTFKEDEPVEEFEFYVHDLLRTIQVKKEKETELEKIPMIRYLIKESEDKSLADLGDDASEEAKTRAEKYVTDTSGFIDLTRAQSQLPIYIGFPRHSRNADEAKKIKGSAEDWETNEGLDDLGAGKYSTYFDVEPLTGVMMAAHKRLQYNIKMTKDMFNGHYQGVFQDGGENGDHIIFPILWLDDYNQISPEDAESFVEAVFDTRDQLGTISIVAIIISVVNCVAGAALVFLGMKGNAGDDLKNRS